MCTKLAWRRRSSAWSVGQLAIDGSVRPLATLGGPLTLAIAATEAAESGRLRRLRVPLAAEMVVAAPPSRPASPFPAAARDARTLRTPGVNPCTPHMRAGT